jgi:hypothetical protein
MLREPPQHVALVLDTRTEMRASAFPAAKERGLSCLDAARMAVEQVRVRAHRSASRVQ